MLEKMRENYFSILYTNEFLQTKFQMFPKSTYVLTCILLENVKYLEMSGYSAFLKSLRNYMYVFWDAYIWSVGPPRYVQLIFNILEFFQKLKTVWRNPNLLGSKFCARKLESDEKYIKILKTSCTYLGGPTDQI